jgi:hypothetical protein
MAADLALQEKINAALVTGVTLPVQGAAGRPAARRVLGLIVSIHITPASPSGVTCPLRLRHSVSLLDRLLLCVVL